MDIWVYLKVRHDEHVRNQCHQALFPEHLLEEQKLIWDGIAAKASAASPINPPSNNNPILFLIVPSLAARKNLTSAVLCSTQVVTYLEFRELKNSHFKLASSEANAIK